MLRRPATTIKLTPEDILEYDDAKAVASDSNSTFANNSQLQEHPSDADSSSLSFKDLNAVRAREDRLGVSRL